MERGKQSGSSFTSDLFGAKDSASSAGIFSSIFAPPAKVSGVVPLHVSETEKKNDSASRQPAGYAKSNVSGGEEGKVEPCHYSSSIYYGGQDFYSQPAQSTAAGLTTFCKDVGEDDSGTASRGNWWQGSLYY